MAFRRIYHRATLSVAPGPRHIPETLRTSHYETDVLLVDGPHAQPAPDGLHAGATGVTLAEPDAIDTTLLGTAMAAATVACLYPSLVDAAVAMGRDSLPRPAAKISAQFERDYRLHLEMLRQRAVIEALDRGG